MNIEFSTARRLPATIQFARTFYGIFMRPLRDGFVTLQVDAYAIYIPQEIRRAGLCNRTRERIQKQTRPTRGAPGISDLTCGFPAWYED